jgi:Tol biopolymer transport system component
MPSWAASYWEWKSARTAPGRPELVIQVETTTKGGKIPSQSLRDKSKQNLMENAVAAQNEADSVVRTLTLKGEPIGQYVNQPLVPGMTFGWSPESLHAVAYAKTDGHLALLDFDRGRVDVAGTKGVLLPAWSPDGTKVVYLQKTGRRDYTLSMVDVTRQ